MLVSMLNFHSSSNLRLHCFEPIYSDKLCLLDLAGVLSIDTVEQNGVYCRFGSSRRHFGG